MIKSAHCKTFPGQRVKSMNWRHIDDLLRGEMASGLVATSLARLGLAAILGGIIGLERELKHRPAGLRTNMFICFGAALFTILSDVLAVEHLGDHTRISAQIIPGIGFIGAASVGMATGGGLYLTAIFTTAVILIALFSLGYLELAFNLKTLLTTYEVTGPSVEEITLEVNRILEHRHRMMQNVLSGNTPQHVRLQFDVAGCNRDQKDFLRELKTSAVLGNVISLGPVELE